MIVEELLDERSLALVPCPDLRLPTPLLAGAGGLLGFGDCRCYRLRPGPQVPGQPGFRPHLVDERLADGTPVSCGGRRLIDRFEGGSLVADQQLLDEVALTWGGGGSRHACTSPVGG